MKISLNSPKHVYLQLLQNSPKSMPKSQGEADIFTPKIRPVSTIVRLISTASNEHLKICARIQGRRLYKIYYLDKYRCQFGSSIREAHDLAREKPSCPEPWLDSPYFGTLSRALVRANRYGSVRITCHFRPLRSQA